VIQLISRRALLLALACAPDAPAFQAHPADGSTGEFRITLLGTGNPRPEMDRFGPGILIEAGAHCLLLDCGRGATQRLFERDLLTSVEDVLFTHLHSDHVTGFPDFWLTGWLFGRNRALRVWGPRGTRSMIRNVEHAYAFDVHMRRDVDERLPADGARIEVHDIGEGVVAGVADGVRVTAFLVDHGPVKPALGYRVEYAGRSVVFSGDTRPSENLVKHAQGVDVLVHEVLAPDIERRRTKMTDPAAVERVIAHHTTAEEAGKLFARIRPKLAVFSHIVPSVAKESDVLPEAAKYYDGRMVFGADRMTIRIGSEIEVRYP
jgi:ribonuclease Z